MIYYSEELSHYGIKGQKWGIRKDKKPTSTKRSGKLHIDSYSSAGYDSKGNRSYKTSKANPKVMKLAEERAQFTMQKVFGKKWRDIKDSQEIYESLLAEVYEETEAELKRNKAAQDYLNQRR